MNVSNGSKRSVSCGKDNKTLEIEHRNSRQTTMTMILANAARRTALVTQRALLQRVGAQRCFAADHVSLLDHIAKIAASVGFPIAGIFFKIDQADWSHVEGKTNILFRQPILDVGFLITSSSKNCLCVFCYTFCRKYFILHTIEASWLSLECLYLWVVLVPCMSGSVISNTSKDTGNKLWHFQSNFSSVSNSINTTLQYTNHHHMFVYTTIYRAFFFVKALLA